MCEAAGLFIRAQVEPEVKYDPDSRHDLYGPTVSYCAYREGSSGLYWSAEDADSARVNMIGA